MEVRNITVSFTSVKLLGRYEYKLLFIQQNWFFQTHFWFVLHAVHGGLSLKA